MSRLSRGPALFLFFILISATLPILAQVSQPNIPTNGLQVLHNHVRPAVSNGQAVQMGVLPSTQRMKLAIMLPLRNQGELTSLLGRLYDPSEGHDVTAETNGTTEWQMRNQFRAWSKYMAMSM